jgi:thiamine phosphate synthase YjbQ (UPF0047 family)
LPGIAVRSRHFTVATKGDSDIVDITPRAQALVDELGVADGQTLAFVRGSTAAISTMEFEPGGIQDLRAMLDRLIPTHGNYEHNRLNHDSNSHAHNGRRSSAPRRPSRSSTAASPLAPGSSSS